MSEEKSVAQKVHDGIYQNDVPYGKNTRKAYRERDGELLAQFWADVKAEYDHDYPPKAWEKLCAVAWDHGHSAGYHEVLMWVEELVQILEAMRCE